ncbi:enoyl-CoA hydratase/isomerase family protein [Natronogracilivirga saccharolytica]|uniref:Enoyl-CoA hydratase/isomerase family protein n=1 Tax=Natronogracilivirga saccharolytica TaxID=2812953 RepID=A0A8J7UVG2_9BACT|nr:enoyl-CoA hydratase-related protein [Natronogracilivirga saccharolytica]MBP3191139.1 enoyl-CoA hydratase/isomerase family protein [Natronogracilivirga saccharolytica]
MNLQPEMLLVETSDQIATVTVNRPEKLNALDNKVLDEFRELFEHIQEDDDIRGVVISGAGSKAFVAGADINELKNLKVKSGERASRKGQVVFSIIESTGKPVIAAVEGYALGGGCELALACHLRVASGTAKFGLPELGLGLIPGYGGTQRLPRLIGKGRALEMILDGTPVDAQRAYEFGLVNRLVDEGRAVDEAKKWLGTIKKNAPIALKKAIQSVHAAYPNRAQGFQDEARLFGYLCGTEDFREGTSAFLEKRKPVFRNE